MTVPAWSSSGDSSVPSFSRLISHCVFTWPFCSVCTWVGVGKGREREGERGHLSLPFLIKLPTLLG